MKIFKLAVGDDNCQGEVYSPTEKTYNTGLGSINFNTDIEGDQTYVKEKIDIVSLDEHIGIEGVPPSYDKEKKLSLGLKKKYLDQIIKSNS